MLGREPETAYIVACDIVGHSRSPHLLQRERIGAINSIVREALSGTNDVVVWASGGDGGHVLFEGNAAAQAIKLTRELRQWALDSDVPLRITAHVGDVSAIEGADGRRQPVGAGINQSGSILEAGSAYGIVVSDAFRDCAHRSGESGLRFHDPRRLSAAGKGEQVLMLMSLPGLDSHWPPPGDNDRGRITAPDTSDAWQLLYHAKRLLQISGAEREVDVFLRRLRAEDFWYEHDSGDGLDRIVNPFLGYLEARSLREVIRVGQLIERDYNEVLCRYGDEGNTMFVILSGQVGVYHVDENDAGGVRSDTPDLILRRGQIVGELAFALNRRRTADLVCLADTALLAFSFADFMSKLASTPGSAQIIDRVDAFITARTLEHVASVIPFLVGLDRTGPLGDGEEPWESLLEDMLFDCGIRSWTAEDGPLKLERLLGAQQSSGGLCFLVSGKLKSRSNPAKILRGEALPLVYAEVAGRLVFPDHEYVVDRPVKLLRVGPDALAVLPERTVGRLASALRSQLGHHYFYDAFLSYNFGDEETVERWRDRLSGAGFKVFVDKLSPGEHFTSNIEASLLDSLVLMAFISPHTMTKPQESNWVRKEIAFREANFNQPWIVPIGLRGANLDEFKLHYTMIDARAEEERAVAAAIELIQAIRSGRLDLPR